MLPNARDQNSELCNLYDSSSARGGVAGLDGVAGAEELQDPLIGIMGAGSGAGGFGAEAGGASGEEAGAGGRVCSRWLRFGLRLRRCVGRNRLRFRRNGGFWGLLRFRGYWLPPRFRLGSSLLSPDVILLQRVPVQKQQVTGEWDLSQGFQQFPLFQGVWSV